MEPQLSKSEEPSADHGSQEFNPQPDEWFAATLTHVNRENKTLTATLSNGERVWIYEREITFSPGGHYFCLPTDGSVEISVRIEKQQHRLYPYRALEVSFSVDDFEPVRERGFVQDWRGNCGGIRRICKCAIFAPPNGSVNARPFFPGDEVEFDVDYSEIKKTYVAKNVELVKSAKTAQ